jgi:hypothetical protein
MALAVLSRPPPRTARADRGWQARWARRPHALYRGSRPEPNFIGNASSFQPDNQSVSYFRCRWACRQYLQHECLRRLSGVTSSTIDWQRLLGFQSGYLRGRMQRRKPNTVSSVEIDYLTDCGTAGVCSKSVSFRRRRCQGGKTGFQWAKGATGASFREAPRACSILTPNTTSIVWTRALPAHSSRRPLNWMGVGYEIQFHRAPSVRRLGHQPRRRV